MPSTNQTPRAVWALNLAGRFKKKILLLKAPWGVQGMLTIVLHRYQIPILNGKKNCIEKVKYHINGRQLFIRQISKANSAKFNEIWSLGRQAVLLKILVRLSYHIVMEYQ